MWKKGKEEPVPSATKEVSPVVTPSDRRPFEPEREAAARSGMAYIGKTVVVKGELSGREDLYIDGEVEGTVELRDNNLTVGPNGRVKANLHAKDITIVGKVQGNVRAIDKVEIRKSGSLIGDIITSRPIIEEGAYVKGSIETQRPEVARAEARKAEAAAAAAAAAPSPYTGVSPEKKLP